MRSLKVFSLLAMATALQLFTLPGMNASTLTHGPVFGGVTPDAANVFVRTSQSATVQLRYGTDPNLTDASLSTSFTTGADADFTKIIPVSGLAAETTYYVNVLVDGVAQKTAPYPSFATFPPDGSSRDFKFVVLTDFVTTNTLTKSYPTFNNASAEDPAFVFIGGDFDHRNPKDLSRKRGMYQDLYNPETQYMDGFVTNILWKYPVVHQWDDHDSGQNNTDKTYAGWADTQEAFQEYMPSYPLPSVTPGIWQHFSYAQADAFVLDCRSQRDVETDTDDANKSMLDGNNLGAVGELQWLENGLLHSTAHWKIIFSSVIINPTTKYPDSWAGYQTEFTALRNFINTNQIKGVLFISGDLHLSAIDNGTNAGFPEMVVTRPNADGAPNCASGPNGQWSEGFYDADCAGYGVVSVLQNPDRVVLETADEFGVHHLSYTISDNTVPPTPTPTPPPPNITRQPANATVAVGQKTTFRVSVSSDRPIYYQWKKNGVDLAGARKATYQTAPATRSDSGSSYSVSVENPYGTTLSRPATLTVR